ncbi:uncharacterized protein LOC123896330 [Trifolium pratense]|uniref:uncharacterized protein LOC123896330 n=1 Tax=Trifolium pratense TaxID=57577 RepID=UPI001E690C88|nr:uncharacterized protein LOC123896330 [Trifolium pratense]
MNLIPTYYMQISWIPSSICSQIDMMTRKFIWKGNSNKGIHLVGWNVVTQSKEDGGLGVRLAREANTTMLELMAIYHDLKIARDLDFSSILCYSDSQIVLDLILKGHNIYHCYVAVITNIQDMLKLNWDVTLSHSLREGNCSADWLAKLGSTNDAKIKFWEPPPEALKSILLSDALRMLHPRV